MLIFHRQYVTFLWILFYQININQTSHIRHLSLSNNINHLTYYSSLKWLYVATIDSISIYDDNLTLLQNISIQNSYLNDYDICKINPCQCLTNLTNNNNNNESDDITTERYRRSKLSQSLNLQNSIDQNNYNLILYLETKNKIENKPYLIDCWSLQTGSCIIRNALNLSKIYYQQISTNEKIHTQKFLFNTDSTIPNHIFPFHFKFNKCNNTPTYLFLTSTLRKNFIVSNQKEKSDDLTDRFYVQCLEQAQRRTIALRAFVYDDGKKKLQNYVNKSMITTIKQRNITVVKDSIMKQQNVHIENSTNKTRSSLNNNKSNLTSIIEISRISSTNPMVSDDHITNKTKTSSLFNFIHEQSPFLNINDYCSEQLSVVRSIYTDFFEHESSDKFRLFQDIIYDENNSSIYLFTNQQYVSKIIRLCEGQISFRHYVELQINCGNEYTLIQKVKLIKLKNNKQYILTIASKSKTLNSLEPSQNSHSAICLYELDQIRNAFIDNILDLSKGNVSLGMAWLHGESVIPQYPAPYGNLARCSTIRDASYLMIYEGSSNIISQPIISFSSDQLTSLEATLVNDYIVILAGTADGKIKKISVQPTTKKAFQFEELFVHFGESILRDMILDKNSRFLYGATKTRLFQVDLHDCDRYKTCFSCLSSQNPYCGWGTTLNRCTLHLHVDNVPDDSTSKYFCSFGFTSLLTDTDDSNNNNNNDKPIYISNAIKYENYIICYSPPSETLININHDSIIIRLFYNNIILTEKNATFYDCSSYLTCTSCMNNSFDCTWQLLTATCFDSDLITEKNTIIINNSLIHQCPRYNVSTKEIFISDGDSFILGEKNRVIIQIIELKYNIQKYFRCILTFINSSIITSIGKINNDSLICDLFQISYENDVGQQNLSFEIEWKECENECTYKKLEALTNFTVNIYKCKYLADSCGSCILLHDNYHCIWCETDKSCHHEINSTICKPNHIISSSMGVCLDPRLRQIYPIIGPQYGRTPIQIYGSSLGKQPHDISVVLINSNRTEYQCHIQIESYIVAQSFICQLPSLPIGVYTIKVTVHSVVSKDRPIFHIVKPIINDIYPNLGPRSGGTLLSIKGKHLTIGSKINIFVGHQPCLIIENEEMSTSSTISDDENNSLMIPWISQLELPNENEEEIIQCRTSKLTIINEHNNNRQQRFVKRQALWIGTITILIDNFTETYSNITYSYTEDPRVHNLSRYLGIQSGGLPFLVYGTNFNSIQTPQFFIEYNNSQVLVENCSVKTPESMLCYGPSLKWIENEIMLKSTTSSFITTTITSTTIIISSSPITHILHARSHDKNHCFEFKFGFFMDDVEYVRNTSTYYETFLLCPDPIIYPFNNDGKRIQYRYDYLTIEGLNLLDVATINDYIITIGSYPCNITSISDQQIVCQPTNRTIEKLIRKKRILLDINTKYNEQAIVRVTLGRRVYILGTLIYTSNIEKRSLVLYYIIASICGFLLTMFIIIVSIIFRRINTKRTRQLNRLQNQIDTLEMRVARECKEAFAELQTDIGEITNDLSHSGVPYHDYRIYCMKILFPNATDEEKYMMLHNIEIPLEANRRNNVRQGLQHLSQLLYNHHFLLLMIRTLEADKINFRLQDRMQFASLISILLQDNIEYLTEILKILLKELIEKSLQQDRNNSKILLRSNASVAEKILSNWFAFLLFGYIKERIGSPLYILFQSIKQQIHKGPIDYFTNESRYSLSEDKLLRQHIDYQSMIVYVIQVEDDKSHLISTPVPIKVLSCDSITQVKEKIVDHFYKNIPFSKRPSIEDFDLEWRIGSHMKLLRDDEKVDNPDTNGFVQVQTLATYKVHDGARLFLNLKPGMNRTNTSSFSSLISSQTNSGGLTSCYTTKNICYTQKTDDDHKWQLLQGHENQILLNSTIDLINLRKDHRLTNTNQLEQSFSNSRSEQNTRFYHLVKSTDREDDDRTLMTNKLVSEVYLTRLLATKGSLQQYIDNFFDTIFCLVDLPLPIKYLFDFLDEQAEYYQIFDSNIIHTWKSNSLPLRFFVNIIKNPDFIFDVEKTSVIDASLSVIAQMFMDSCAAGIHQLTKDSPSSKLLFYRDVQKYKKLVEKYYDAVSSLPTVSIHDLDQHVILIKEQENQNSSNRRTNDFNRTYALFKLYNEFINRYKTSLRIAITNDFHDNQYRLAALFEQIVTFMDSFELDI
ncbi:unnamed protein product [Rotaria sp. Silwood1]|nr:unnamed protein product [Rotaria sp. Silwood1]CAF1168433.1 unnamed protein product [Rotaria sp. Silwood1]CAF3486939.1 unnamed protein product [Rotaria sp. Silwood1]CAF4597476.1 unnamed protein product [Rotaria sp. Silwood1]